MHIITPALWTLFGFCIASAIYLPFFGMGGVFALCAVWLLISVLVTERRMRK